MSCKVCRPSRCRRPWMWDKTHKNEIDTTKLENIWWRHLKRRVIKRLRLKGLKISCDLVSHRLLHGQNKIHLHALKGRTEPYLDPTVNKGPGPTIAFGLCRGHAAFASDNCSPFWIQPRWTREAPGSSGPPQRATVPWVKQKLEPLWRGQRTTAREGRLQLTGGGFSKPYNCFVQTQR